MDSQELAICSICKETKPVSRVYYRYDIKCDCCNSKEDNHFEIVRHCSTCTPKAPVVITVHMQPIKF